MGTVRWSVCMWQGVFMGGYSKTGGFMLLSEGNRVRQKDKEEHKVITEVQGR